MHHDSPQPMPNVEVTYLFTLASELTGKPVEHIETACWVDGFLHGVAMMSTEREMAMTVMAHVCRHLDDALQKPVGTNMLSAINESSVLTASIQKQYAINKARKDSL